MRITFSADEELIRRAREHAKALGTTLNQLIREFLERIAAGDPNPHTLPAKYGLSQRQPQPDKTSKP
jgi:antitoxin component of RelBE/YafQ-DinJ toxin-antitoxin module